MMPNFELVELQLFRAHPGHEQPEHNDRLIAETAKELPALLAQQALELGPG
jgi:hypothetical protein